MESEPVQMTYHGSPAYAGQFASALEAEGVRVDWVRPTEERGLGDAATNVAVILTAWGAKEAIKAGVAKFRERNPNAEIDWREDDAFR